MKGILWFPEQPFAVNDFFCILSYTASCGSGDSLLILAGFSYLEVSSTKVGLECLSGTIEFSPTSSGLQEAHFQYISDTGGSMGTVTKET